MADEYALQAPVGDEYLLRKARDQIGRNREQRQRALEGHAIPDALINYTCDVTLSHQGLARLPAELIDVVRNDVTRLALDHNRLTGLSGLGPRITQCVKLRYLVLRNNKLKEFPMAVLQLDSLEYLDLKVNRIEVLPDDLFKMASLKVLALQSNRINKIPICVGHMESLIHVNARKNPITFPPKDQWTLPDLESTAQDGDKEKGDAIIMAETIRLKAVMQQYLRSARQEAAAEFSDHLETPRPTRRKTSGRFPIKPSVSGTDLRTETSLPNMFLAAPPIPSKSFARPSLGPAANLAPGTRAIAIQRPALNPIASAFGERNRSHSESVMSTSMRNKRMGMLTRKPVEASVAEVQAENRLSHLRGMSDGAALQDGKAGPSSVTDSSSPTSPVDGPGGEHRDRSATFIRRLSSLPEGKRKSQMDDPYFGLARGVLYALDQLNAPMKRVIGITRDGARSDLQKALSQAYGATNMLDQLLNRASSNDEEIDDEEQAKIAEAVRTSCEQCMEAFEQLALTLQSDLRKLILQSEQPCVRTVMHMLYASLIEIRNSCSKLGVEAQPAPKVAVERQTRGRYLSPAPNQPLTSLRVREQTPTHVVTRSNSRNRMAPAPRQTGGRPPPRSDSTTSLNSESSTLRPPPAHSTRSSRSNTLNSVDEVVEDPKFNEIAKKLTHASDLVMQALPPCEVLVLDAKRTVRERASSPMEMEMFDTIVTRCQAANEAAKQLRSTLLTLELRAPGIKNQLDFWQLVMSFVRAYFLFAGRVKDAYQGPTAHVLTDEIKLLLKPVHRVVKDVSQTINESPWSALVATPGQQPPLATAAAIASGAALPALYGQTPYGLQNQHPPRTGMYTPTSQSGTPTHSRPYPALSLSTRGPLPPPNALDPLSATSTQSSLAGGMMSSGYQTPLPPTPMSAALGPAALATMPMSHPGSALTIGVPTSAQVANLPPQANGLFTPTMSVTPSPMSMGGVPHMNLNNLASPNLVTTMSTPTIIPGSILSPPTVITAYAPPPAVQQHTVSPKDHASGGHPPMNGYATHLQKTGASATVMERAQTQQGHQTHAPPPSYGGSNGIMQRTRSVSQRRI